MNIYQKNLLTKQIYPLKKINNKWIIEKYYKMNSFFLIEKMNKYSNVINIANCLLDGHKFKITDKGESRYIKFNNNTLYIDFPKSNYIYTVIEGGFGNQLFMIFNIIALSKKYKKKYNIKYDDNYIKNYLKSKNTLRKSSSEYNLLKKIEFNNIDYNNFIKYQEKDYKYNKITLLPKNNYYIKGYFQSYKYFWDNKDEIKEALFIDDNIINEIKNKFKKYNKPILSIHIRLGDYLLDTDFHPIPTIDYYRQALSYYNLDKYQIILFSDNIELAKQKLAEFKLNYIDANTINTNDEYQFYMLCLSNVKICANSSFSLMSCYFNEIYNFIDNAEYIFPHKWFGKKGPNYDVNDLIPNYKFFVINYDNTEEYNKKKYDVVTTLHIKDKDRYKFFLKYNKKYLTNAHRFYYVSYQKYDDLESNFVSESKYQFSKNDVIDYIKDYIPNYRWGWYYQQLLKLYSFRANITSKEFILIFDSDILLLKPLLLFDNDKPILYKRNTGNKKIHTPYKISMEYILPELKGLSNDSGICHLMLFKKDLLEDLLIKIEKYYKKEAWKVCLDSVIYYIKNYNYNESVLSEYELYYAYIKKYKYYKIDTNLKYSDISLNNIDLTDTEYNYIADHHYASREKDDWMKDNLIEEEIINIEKLDNINIILQDLYMDLYNNINNLFIKYNCNVAEDRIKIINKNNQINNYLRENNSISNKNIQNFSQFFKNIDLKEKINYTNYSEYSIYHNKSASLKNHIIIYKNSSDLFDEIILNVNYTIISDNLDEYDYTIPLKKFKGNKNNVEYIIYNKYTVSKVKKFIKKYKSKKLDLFLSEKVNLLQICLPTFKNIPLRLKKYYNSNNFDNFWNIKLDKKLCEKFIKKNFNNNLYLCYSLIYSATSKTDFIRHLFLYKYSGCYFDLSIKILNKKFLELLNDFEFISSRDEDHNSIQNGILYIKKKYSKISEKFILEVLSGVLNYNSNENNKLSFLYNQNPSNDPFFYGPITLFKIYDEEKNKAKYKLLNTYLNEKKQISEYHWEFESKSIDKYNNIEYLQVKYIGYNKDIRSFTKNIHYSESFKKGLHFYSPLNYLDKILIINLKHREDRKNEILQELNKFQIEKDKIIFIEAVYNKKDGALGCTASHIKCMEYALNNNLDNVLILEDDYDFCKNINLFNIELTKFLASNVNWDVLLLYMSEHGPPVNIKTDLNNVYLNLWSHSTAAYILKKNIFKDLLKIYKKSFNSKKGPIDFHWNNLRLKYNWYINKKILGYQRESYSDIEKNIVNYNSDLNIHFY